MNLDRILGNLGSSGVLGGLAGGAVSGALMGNKKGRKAAGKLLQIGGVAALGTLAWKAYQNYQADATRARGNAAVDPSWQGIREERFAIAAGPSGADSTALLLVQAMIAAACADGHIDAVERERILTRVDGMGLSAEERAMVFDALQSPLPLAALCERVDSPEVAAEVYMASLMAVDRERPEARLYLDALAFRLGLPEALVLRMHDSVAALDQPAVA